MQPMTATELTHYYDPTAAMLAGLMDDLLYVGRMKTPAFKLWGHATSEKDRQTSQTLTIAVDGVTYQLDYVRHWRDNIGQLSVYTVNRSLIFFTKAQTCENFPVAKLCEAVAKIVDQTKNGAS